MRILPDESVPQKLRLLIEEGHTVATAWFRGWSGRRKIALVALSANNWAFIKAQVGLVVAAIDAALPGSYSEVQIPEREY